MKKFRAYYQLVKPGVMYGNVLTGAAGFLLASQGDVQWLLFVATIVGMTLVVSSACALNNYLDRDIDSKMERTKARPSVTGAVAPGAILRYAIILGVIGIGVLALWTNWLVVAIGMVGFVTYVWFYGAWSKRQSIHGTLVGSISGAMPIAGGYAAVSGQIDIGLVIAFLVLFFWQFPEFYSIAIYRRKEYAAAKVPVMSVVKGIQSSIVQIYIYTGLYVLSTLALTFAGLTGWIYFAIMAAFGIHWMWVAYLGLRTSAPEKWAKRMFKLSMVNVLAFCVMCALGPLWP
ncbi:MAG: heme o synthase [Candidatus Saccharimonas sp.]